MGNLFGRIGPTELIIIGVVLIVLFGAKRIADLGRHAGEASKEIKNIKKEFTGAMEEEKPEVKEEG